MTGTEDADTATRFADLGLADEVLATLVDLGYEEPTPIQAEAIPHLLAGADLLGQAATGTGKTAAFALPIVERVADRDAAEPVALVLVPTRELAVQVRDAVEAYGRRSGVRVVAVFGGQPVHRQIRVLERGVHVVVATPGRAVDLIDRRSLDLSRVECVVLDEADEMLDMGFAEDLDRILEATPSERQTVLLSATLPHRITGIAERHQRDPVRVAVGGSDADGEGGGATSETAYVVDRRHKAAALCRVLDVEDPDAAIVFCRTRAEVDELTVLLNGRNHRAEALHGGMDQEQRDRVMGRLRDGTAELLIATDVAARGLDVDTLTHVVNYDVPAAPESYVHRIGRVGRAGRSGTAITLIEPKQRRLLQNIERRTGNRVTLAKVPTVEDLRSSQVSRLVETLETAVDQDVDDTTVAAVLDELVDVDPRALARAAISLLRDADGELDERHIPDAADRKGPKGKGRDDRGGSRGNDRPRSGGGKGTRPTGDVASVFISLGRSAGVRPADLVGAIANDAGIPGRDIGPIRVADRHSVVGVPAADIDRVIDALNRGSVRGKDVRARRFVE